MVSVKNIKRRIPTYKVEDLQGEGFMSDTHDEPMTLEELRERFWGLDEGSTEFYKEFTLNHIKETWEVEFIQEGYKYE